MGIPYADPLNTQQWAADFLTDISAPLTASNENYVELWETAESPSGWGYNPLGTEETANKSKSAQPGSTSSHPVQAYTSWDEGLSATLATLSGDSGNATLVKDLQKGNASVSTLDQAQTLGSWATGDEPNLAGSGASTAFKYGGSYGEQPGVAGVAASSKGVFGDIGFTITHPFQIGEQGGSDIGGAINSGAGAVASKAGSSVFGPVVKWVEEGAADVTFVGFGLLLIVVGLLVTFKGDAEETAPAVAAGAVA